MAVGDQYLCSFNARGWTTKEQPGVVRHLAPCLVGEEGVPASGR
jgi:hypothetical protein